MSSLPTAAAATATGSSSPPGSPSRPTAPGSPTNCSLLTPSAVLSPSASAPLTSQTGALTVGATSGTAQLTEGSRKPLSTDSTANSGAIDAATTTRIMELWGMFSQVMQMTLGSAVHFFGEYVGINQRMGQLEEENLNHEERYMSRKYELRKALSNIPREQRYVPKRSRVRKPKQPSFLRSFILRLLRHVALFALAYLLSKRIASWAMARSGRKLLETSASEALVSADASNTRF
ncbi:hypothetical protein CGC21_7915 [Leishmania donovani]|uniref:Uncharacterized protein n=1 Tax=Leishmania donovani TaxID=5661 RepID=A0A504XF36_LEIDO|nr:hypothetical protein CGC21_7915 [Leishmania donovani]